MAPRPTPPRFRRPLMPVIFSERRGADLVHRGLRQSEKDGDRTPQVRRRVQLDRRLVEPKMSPRKQRQTQVDGRRIERKNGLVKFLRERFVHVELPGAANQRLSPIRINPPVPSLVVIGQRAAHHRTAKPHLIKQLGPRAQGRRQIPQTLPVGQLRERYGEPLVVTRKTLHLRIATVAFDAATKYLLMSQRHDLRKHREIGHGRSLIGRPMTKTPLRTQYASQPNTG